MKRKVEQWLKDWKSRKHVPALVSGIRQCGKTTSVLKFARENYSHVIYLNFMEDSLLSSLFAGDLRVDTLVSLLSVHFPDERIIPYRTVFIFDEIQECPKAYLSLKSFSVDGRYDVIATGSYIGIKGYDIKDGTPLPVGYAEPYIMKTMDFEEFLWALGIGEETIDLLYRSLVSHTPLPEGLYQMIRNYFYQYICIGGFPEAVKTFLKTKQLGEASRVVKKISLLLENDFGRKKDSRGNVLFRKKEVARIRNAYDLIPSFLGKEDNKRFIVSKIKTGDQDNKKEAIDYLCDFGIAMKCFNLTLPSLPLSSQVIDSTFKLYIADIGLLVNSMEQGTKEAILLGNLGMGKGMLYEELVAEALYKNGEGIFYFRKDSGLEVDFVMNLHGQATLLECKSQNGHTKSARTVLSHPEHYGKTRLIKITDRNISFENGILTIPHFLTFLLRNEE